MYSPLLPRSLWLPIFAVLISCFTLLFSCSPNTKMMNKGVRQLAKKKPEKAGKTFERLKNHPLYDLSAEYYLLGLRFGKTRKLHDWAIADSAYLNLKNRLSLCSAEKKQRLKAYKLSDRSLANKRIKYERKAFQLVEQQGSVILLDSVDRLFLPWELKVVNEWEKTRTQVVNRNLPTTDYNVATSIINNHAMVVDAKKYAHFWKISEDIWDLFELKYPKCKMDRFQADHPGHYYSRDCWFEEARQVYCSQSLDSALVFLNRYPHSRLEQIMLNYVEELSKNKQAVANLLPSEQKHLLDLELYSELQQTLICGSPDTATLRRDIYHYIETKAPSRSSFRILQLATNYYLQINQPRNAFNLLTDMRRLLPDTAICATDFDFQIKKQPWINRALECLDAYAERPIPQFVRRWNTGNYQEFSAVSWDEGKEAYFARKEGKKTWVMRSVLENDDWTQPQRVEVLSIEQKASPMSITADGLQMLLKAGRFLYISTRADEGAAWGPPQKLSRSFPAMSRAVFAPDGSAILLDASFDAAELWGKPANNLYYCERNAEGKFKKPKSLGSTINTRNGREANPYLCADGKTLLFCSTGHSGFGKLDVFVSRRKGDSWSEWTEPVSLGCPINSFWDDYGFTWVPDNGKGAFFTEIDLCDANRDRDIWETDLPSDARPQPRSQLRGQLFDLAGKPITKGFAEIMVEGQPPVSVQITPTGAYRFVLPEKAEKASIYVSASGFYTPRDTAHVVKGMPAGTVLRDTFRLIPTKEIQKSFRFKYARFDEGRATLNDPRVYKELSLLSRFAKGLSIKLTLVCQAEDKGTPEQSLKLAQDRAEVLKGILRDSFKITEKRLSAVGRKNTKSPTEPDKSSKFWAGVEFERAADFTPTPKPSVTGGTTAAVGGNANSSSGGSSSGGGKHKVKPKPIDVEPEVQPLKKRKSIFKRIYRWVVPKKKAKTEDSKEKEEVPGSEEEADEGS